MTGHCASTGVQEVGARGSGDINGSACALRGPYARMTQHKCQALRKDDTAHVSERGTPTQPMTDMYPFYTDKFLFHVSVSDGRREKRKKEKKKKKKKKKKNKNKNKNKKKW